MMHPKLYMLDDFYSNHRKMPLNATDNIEITYANQDIQHTCSINSIQNVYIHWY